VPLRRLDQPPLPVKHSRRAKVALGIALSMVVYFFLLHSVIEAFILGKYYSGASDEMTLGLAILFYALPGLGMLICAAGTWLAIVDLRRPFRNREFALMAVVINPVLFVGLVVLVTLIARMR
jgi:hypothetical protein